MIRIEMQRISGNYGLEVRDSVGHLLQTDSSKQNGGDDNGFRPMQLMLAALGSCSVIDMVSILQKQKQIISSLKIIIEGEREQDVIPSLWKNIQVHFKLSGDINFAKATRAAELSIEKYCSVAETLRRAGASISYTIELVSASNSET